VVNKFGNKGILRFIKSKEEKEKKQQLTILKQKKFCFGMIVKYSPVVKSFICFDTFFYTFKRKREKNA
jgi:hypothetical protein